MISKGLSRFSPFFFHVHTHTLAHAHTLLPSKPLELRAEVLCRIGHTAHTFTRCVHASRIRRVRAVRHISTSPTVHGSGRVHVVGACRALEYSAPGEKRNEQKRLVV